MLECAVCAQTLAGRVLSNHTYIPGPLMNTQEGYYLASKR